MLINCGIMLINCGIMMINCGTMMINCGIMLINCGIMMINCGTMLINCGTGPIGRTTAEGWLAHLPYNFNHYLSYCFFSGTAALELFLKCHSRTLKKLLVVTAPASKIAT